MQDGFPLSFALIASHPLVSGRTAGRVKPIPCLWLSVSPFCPIKSMGLVSFIKNACSICYGVDAETTEVSRKPGWLTLDWALGAGPGGWMAEQGIGELSGGFCSRQVHPVLDHKQALPLLSLLRAREGKSRVNG